MSRDWTKEELQAASEQMKKAGHLSYEEFCEKLKETSPRIFSNEQIKVALAEHKEKQINGDLRVCPRCGKERMRDVLTHNSLSRHADVYVCEACGMDEALLDMKEAPLPLIHWHYAEQMETEAKKDEDNNL